MRSVIVAAGLRFACDFLTNRPVIADRTRVALDLRAIARTSSSSMCRGCATGGSRANAGPAGAGPAVG